MRNSAQSTHLIEPPLRDIKVHLLELQVFGAYFCFAELVETGHAFR